MGSIFQERHNIKVRKLSAKKNLINGEIIDKEYSKVDLERSYTQMRKTLIPHILAQYELKKEYQDKIVELNSVLDDDKRTIKSLEEALMRAQNRLEVAARSASGQQGARTRCLHEFIYSIYIIVSIFSCA
jgi:chromosome segregation ATPase